MRESAESERFKAAVALADEGLALMRQNLRRRHPEATEGQIDELYEQWLLDRPMDAPGKIVHRPAS